MEELQPQLQSVRTTSKELLYFWALGDLHYSAHAAWQALHTPRLAPLFQDLRQLWAREGVPAFCVSPGDIVEMGAPEHYQWAGQQLRANLGSVKFYPGVGNHELLCEGEESEEDLLDDFATFWSQPPHYYWEQGNVVCIMLDVVGYPVPMLTSESLAFLKTALAKHPRHIAIVFAHCPLYNTVLARDMAADLDYDSLDPFFSVENSAEVRRILARHDGACLYVSGHTHTGWKSPTLVVTDNSGVHPALYVNLSSPWYTGRHNGARWLEEEQRYDYRADQPDHLISLAVHISREKICLRLRDHLAGNWLSEWNVPLK
jgi:3',5'-cyclic AMP phosphodiesterase CpdA